jgi:hypothetical protein
MSNCFALAASEISRFCSTVTGIRKSASIRSAGSFAGLAMPLA